MTYGTPPDGEDAIFYVGSTSSPTTPLGGLFNWNDTEDLPTNERRYYMQPSITSVGKSLKVLTAQCDYEEGDDGQKFVFAARLAKASFFISTAPGGVNGETVEIRVTHQEIAGPDVNGFSTINWTFSQVGAPVALGAGYGG